MSISRKDAERILRQAGYTKAQAQAAVADARKNPGNKYGAKQTRSDILDRVFHSDAERRYGQHLHARQQAGEIEGLRFQVRVQLAVGGPMIVDFFFYEDGEPVWNEFKGFATPKWREQRRRWEQLGPGEYRVTREKRSDPIHPWRHERIFPRPSDKLIAAIDPFIDEYRADREASGGQ